MHVYEVHPRKDHRGVDLVSDALPFGRLWYALEKIVRARQANSPQARLADSNSRNAVSFSSARTIKGFPLLQLWSALLAQ
jgi:hypothetical protein